MPGYLGRFIDSLARHCDELVGFFHTPLPHEMPQSLYRLESPNVVFVDIGPHVSVPKRLLSIPRVKKITSRWRGKLDCMLLRGPTPLLPAIADAFEPTPLALLLVGDQLAGIDSMPQSGVRKETIRLLWKSIDRRQREIARRSLTFVNSHLLYEKLQGAVPLLVETRTTTLSETDVFIRQDTCLHPPYHILYTGRMERTKGILDTLEAIGILVSEGVDLVYDLVGPEDKSDPVLGELRSRADELGISGRVIVHGYKEAGPELFEFYKLSDIYVISSQSSEGFPRTIWEAMAHSLPVIATSVGSIPDYAGCAVEIIPPKDVSSIAQAMRTLISDPARRQQMIRAGRELARENTLEKRTVEMMTHITQYLANRMNTR